MSAAAPNRTMRAAVLVDVAQMEIRDVPVALPRPGEVLLRVAAVGLCGTDFHIYSGEGNYHADAMGRLVPLREHPQILGHEIAAVVEEAGPGVYDLRPGDLVIADQGRHCMSAAREPMCEYCASGDSHQCLYYAEHGITGLPGALAEFITLPAVNVIPVRAELPAADLALAEPLACIIHACDMLERTPGRYLLHGDGQRRARSVLIFGAGPAGLLFTQYLRQGLGYEGDIIVSEPDALKRSLAERFGAIGVDPAADDLTEAVYRITDGRRAEIAIDAAGAAGVFSDIPSVLRKQGTVVLYGHGRAGGELTALNNVQFLEPTLISPIGASGAFEPDGRSATYHRALKLLMTGTIEVRPLITHRYRSLDQVPAAFTGVHRAPDYVKAVVELAI